VTRSLFNVIVLILSLSSSMVSAFAAGFPYLQRFAARWHAPDAAEAPEEVKSKPSSSGVKGGTQELSVEMVELETARIREPEDKLDAIANAMLMHQLAERDQVLSQRVSQQLAERDQESAQHLSQQLAERDRALTQRVSQQLAELDHELTQRLMQQISDMRAAREVRPTPEQTHPEKSSVHDQHTGSDMQVADVQLEPQVRPGPVWTSEMRLFASVWCFPIGILANLSYVLTCSVCP
jgi:hypothetical protein